MSVEVWNATWTFLSLIVFGVTALAAMRQLRHVRANNEIQALMAVQHDFQRGALQHALALVATSLPTRLEDPGYRAELETLGFVDPERHPEMEVCNWFDGVGTLVKNGLVNESAFHELFGRLVDRSWTTLGPAIALLRRNRGRAQYQNFEYLVVRYRAWHARYPDGRYPRGMPRLAVDDPWPPAAAVAEPTADLI